MTKGVIFCAIAWVALAACSKHNVTISGSIKHAGKEQVYLEQINVGYNVTVDSAQTDKDGKFTFKTYVELPTFFNVKVGESGPVTFIASADEDIQISGTLEGLEQNYWVDGSENSLWIKLLNFQLNNTLTAMDSLQETFKAIPEDNAAKRAEVAHAWDSVVNKQINFSKEFILKHAVSPASYYALYQKFNDNSFILDPIEDLHSYKIVASSLKAMYPESQYTKAILQHLDQISNSIQNERIRRIIDNADSNLPAISLPNASGDTIALSDLRGKYIMLEFNVLGAKESEGYTQELKKVYNKFRNRGVEIYQVCLDNNQLLWSRLVKQYGITWQCVRDPQGLQSRVAQTWNVQTVPANYIINPKFEIVGKNLTGARLEERLNDLMKQR